MVSVQFLGAYHYEKKYRVLVARSPEEEQLANWQREIVLEYGYQTSPVAEIKS